MTEMSPPATPGASSALAWANRLRAVASIAVIALVGEALGALRDWSRPDVAVAAEASQAGETIFIASGEERAEPVWPFDDGPRVILSRLPVELDPFRWVLHLPGERRRVVPSGWPTVLVDREGKLARHDFELNARQVDGLRVGIGRASDQEEAFANLRNLLAAKDPRLKEFWSN